MNKTSVSPASLPAASKPASEFRTLSPVRIYVLWHPGLDGWDPDKIKKRDLKKLTNEEKAQTDRGLKLARHIYHWFRLDNKEGIPVYFRSMAARNNTEEPLPIDASEGVLNYVIPLVDENMVASPEWRAYVKRYADLDPTVLSSRKDETYGKKSVFRVLPVAVDGVAYNMPDSMRKLNFIRFIANQSGTNTDGMQLISKLTEVLCRDLRSRINAEASGKRNGGVPGKIKIFLSHAKADDTREAIELKEFIQRETQCEAFFDETDIASGHDFTSILDKSIREDSAGLIVIQGDNYADRPWCRKEIRDFLKPLLDPVAKLLKSHRQYFIPPVVVVQTMKGKQIARTIAELGYSPCISWQDGAARLVVTALLREILFGLFYRALAKLIGEDDSTVPDGSKSGNLIYINRAPDPVMIHRIVKELKEEKDSAIIGTGALECIHPGYGLSNMEKEGLMAAISGISFSSFLDRTSRSDLKMNLAGKLIAVSVGNSEDLLSKGIHDEHTQELLIRILRPLLRGQASVLYGGRTPDLVRKEEPWKEDLDFTAVFIHLLLTERELNPVSRKSKKDSPVSEVPVFSRPRLYLMRGWAETIDVKTIAQWTDICTFVKVPLPAPGTVPFVAMPIKPAPLSSQQLEELSEPEKSKLKADKARDQKKYEADLMLYKACSLSAMRRKICDMNSPLTCTNPDEPTRREIRTFAHIFVGGKLNGFSGIMPGLFEELLHAFNARKPVFLISAYGGAAALVASWLLEDLKGLRPAELTVDYYTGKDENFNFSSMIATVQKAPEGTLLLDFQTSFDELWAHINGANKNLAKLLNNGLDDKDNYDLLKGESTRDICKLIWRGCDKLALRDKTTSRR